MTDPTYVSFAAQIVKVQTLADGGWRVTLDGGQNALAAAAVLMAIRDGVVTVTVTDSESGDSFPPDEAHDRDAVEDDAERGPRRDMAAPDRWTPPAFGGPSPL